MTSCANHLSLAHDYFIKLREGNVFTTRKRSLGQGNIFIGVCQEFCSQGGGPGLGGLLLGGAAPGGVPGGDPPDGYRCGQFASYWNAFLLHLCVILSFWGISVRVGESLSRRVSVRGVSVQGCLCPGGLCQGDPRTVKSGRYASHWNAFFLLLWSTSYFPVMRLNLIG